MMDNESTIEVSKPKHNFTILDNKMLRDDSISLEARGLLGNLLSNDDGWKISVKAMTHYLYKPEILGIVDSGIGKDKIYRIMKELIAAGYMERITVRESGRIKSVKYKVYGSPLSVGLTSSGFAVNGSASYGNDSLLKNKQEEVLLIKSNTSLSNIENPIIEEDLLSKTYAELQDLCKSIGKDGHLVLVNYWYQLTSSKTPKLERNGLPTTIAKKLKVNYATFLKDKGFFEDVFPAMRDYALNIVPIKKDWATLEWFLGTGKGSNGPGWKRVAEKQAWLYRPDEGKQGFVTNGVAFYDKPDVIVYE